MPRRKKEEGQEVEKTTTKKIRKKKVTEDNEITRAALLYLAGKYGRGNIGLHRLEMNYGKAKTVKILDEVDKLKKSIVK